MSARQRADQKPDQRPATPVDPDFIARRLESLEAEAAGLRDANTALREQLSLRDHALDATSIFFVITRDAAPAPIIVYCNKVAAEQHGFLPEELIGKPISVLRQWAGGSSRYIEEVRATLTAGKSFQYEDEVVRRDGTTYWLGVTIRPLFDADGRLTHSVAVGADITAKREEIQKKQALQQQLVEEMRERERMGTELQLAQKLESVGRLAAGVAHEINTPIQYVGDSVHFLRSAYDDLNQLLDGCRQAVDALPAGAEHDALKAVVAEAATRHDLDFLRDEIPRAFERTFDGVERVTNIVKAMKEFAHPDEKEHSPSDLNHALRTTLLVASNEYKYLARIETDFAELPLVTCNVGELNQVFLNLIVNAAHAIHDAGRDVSTGCIHVSTGLDGDTALIRIRDNGCGVPPENLSKLYDPFFTTKEVGRGTGQGLAITHSILVDKHGGDISVQSTVGLGTEFTLRLLVGGRGAPGGAMKDIVFVDDERELLDGLRARLYKHRHEWNMQFLLSGDEAIGVFEKQNVDLIVSDVRMPGMDGGQLLSVVKQRWPNTVRIIVSGYSDPAQAVRLTSLAHQYVAKPCDGLQLENIIERCFNLQDLLSQEPLRKVVGRIGNLPAMPKTYGRLQAALSQPSVTAAEIGDIVNADAAIASKVLQITNSAFFRLRKPMVRIKDAVTYLGFATIRNLVLSAEIFSQWKTPPGLSDIDPEQLQNHAQIAAVACKSLADGRVTKDDAWLAGLLHDLGYWILIQECPQELARALELSRSEKLPLFDCEQRIIGATHAQIGAYLLGLWGLPYTIVEAVALHHTPTTVKAHGYDLLGALAVSHSLLEPRNTHALGALDAASTVVDASYLAGLNAPFDWQEAEHRVSLGTTPAE